MGCGTKSADSTARTETIPDPQPSPESAYSQAESLEILDAILGKMKPLLREALVLTY